MSFITRFAPSPTGPLHLGHAFSALLAHDMARNSGGVFLLRMEDIDTSRARADWESRIYDDLAWLGLSWEKPVLRQSEQMERYAQAINHSNLTEYLYPCACSRADIKAAISAPQEGVPQIGPDGQIYPGTCRPQDGSPRSDWAEQDALRLDLARLQRDLTHDETFKFSFLETGQGPNAETGLIEFTFVQAFRDLGDIVVRRKDMGTSYHLSVVLDDAQQGITHVIRGQDLFEATKIHVILQTILGLPTPIYHHHKLIRDDAGKRLAKRDDARAISKYRDEGLSPDDLRNRVGL